MFSYDEIRDMLENEELRRPCYLYELRFETMNKESYVEFDRDSINNFTYELEEKMIKHVTYACQDYYDKGGRFICRNSTRLPAVPMVDALYSLIFAPRVAVKAHFKQKYFNKIIVDDGETQIKLTHILTHQDLEIIQKIRTMLNESLCNEEYLKQAHLSQVDFCIKRLFGFNRLPLDVYEKLLDLRESDPFFMQKEASKDAAKFDDGEANFFLSNDAPLNKDGEGYEELEGNAAADQEDEDVKDDKKDIVHQAVEELFDCRGLSVQERT